MNNRTSDQKSNSNMIARNFASNELTFAAIVAVLAHLAMMVAVLN